MKTASIPAGGIIGARLVEAAAAEIRQVVELVRAEVGKQLGREWVSVDAIYPDRIVISQNSRQYAYPYTLTDDNQVQLQPRHEVVQMHAPVRMVEAAGELGAGDVAFIESVGEPDSGVWTIRVIRAGASGNDNYYPDAVLRDAVRLIEGARVFEKSDEQHIAAGKNGVVPGKSFRNLIGGLKNVRFVEGAAPDTGEVLADLHLIQPDGDVAVRVREAHTRGLSHLFGFSIDASAKAKVITRGGRKLRQATQITNVHSVDLIVEPGAGGALLRITEAQTETTPQEDADMQLRQRMIEAIMAHNPQFDGAAATDEQIEAAYSAAVAATVRVTEARNAGDAALDAVRLVEARIVARDLVGAAKLPQPAKDRILARFIESQAPYTAADVTRAIEDERAYLARFTESGRPVIHFDETVQVEDRSEKIGEMLDGFFAGTNGVHSFKECYIEITGDRRVSGDVRDVDMARLRESLGDRFVESLASSSWANVLGDSITRRMLAEYEMMTDLQSWRRVATAVPVNDFRTQERTRIGGYGNLPAVAQGAGYAALTSPTDEKATYAVTKRGGTEDVTLEMVRNDDVGALRRIPTELALAAANTLYEFVFDFFRTNPTIYDGVALFHATHANLGTTALDATNFAAARLAMVNQVRAGSLKKLGIGPAAVLVPFELQEAAYNLFVRNQNLDKTFVQTINPEVIPVGYWTDANDWVAVADPRRIPTIEVGFLDGREEPELFVQDMPNVGSMFSNDKITYKIRHIYSGAVMDYRGMRKHVVA